MIHSYIQKNNTDLDLEDARTGLIIGTLLHLPDAMIWKILMDSCYEGKDLITDVGVLESYDFWPSWNAKGTTNELRVEPDVFLRFSNLDVIIEVKRSDYGGQYEGEWDNEIKAYENEYQNGKMVILIALGGNGEIKEKIENVFRCSWLNLRQTIDEVSKEVKTSEQKRIFSDLFLSFDVMGFRKYEWLSQRKWISELVIEDIDCAHVSIMGGKDE